MTNKGKPAKVKVCYSGPLSGIEHGNVVLPRDEVVEVSGSESLVKSVRALAAEHPDVEVTK